MGRKTLSLFVLAAVLIAAAVLLFTLRQAGARDHITITYEEVLSMPSTRAVYHSINNWQTVEDTEFEGVILSDFLEDKGVEDDGAEVKLIAPDGYFWPAVGTLLTLSDLKQANASGLYPLLAWEMDGIVLQPEPDGSGPLRLVMPQYNEEEVNKPSWVSNVRLVEVGPIGGDGEAPDALEVPVDEVWIYGDVPAAYPYAVIYPIIALLAGLFALAAAILSHAADRKGKRAAAQVAAVLVLTAVLVAATPLALPRGSSCRADPGGRVFSMGELASMPAFSGHYTFLKSQEPFTYYEADYRGVPLSYLIEEKLSLSPAATGVRVKARDGYDVSLSLAEIRNTYPGGLEVIIAYEKDGAALVGDEGPLRLVVPQSVPGEKERGGEPNTPLCAWMIYTVEVLPLPAGEQPPAEGTVPEGSLAVYGAVSEPAPQPLAPEPPAPQPAQPEEEQNEAGEQAQEQPGPAPAVEEPAVTSVALISDPAGAFSVHWMVMSSMQVQPFQAVLPLLFFVNRERRAS